MEKTKEELGREYAKKVQAGQATHGSYASFIEGYNAAMAEVLQREEAAFNASRETDEYGLTDTNGNTKLKYENFNHYNTKP